jgi:hypothetical protein
MSTRVRVALRVLGERRARGRLKSEAALWAALQSFIRGTQSTGCGYIDYAELYAAIRRCKPREVLECGSGVSTLVIAHALEQNEAETGLRGRVTSMDEHQGWSDQAAGLLPPVYSPFVDFRVSPTVEDTYSLFRGVRYRDVPDRDYAFVFIDGPSYKSPVDGTLTFDYDFLHVLKNSKGNVQALIDKRVSTCFVLQQLLGSDKVKYSPVRGLGFVAPCGATDLGDLTKDLSSRNFEKSFRLFSGTKLSLAPLSP